MTLLCLKFEYYLFHSVDLSVVVIWTVYQLLCEVCTYVFTP